MDSGSTPRPLHILLIEDSEHDWLAFGRAFEQSGVPFELARYGRAEEALDALEADAGSFDLVVTDYRLPGMSGLELCRELLERKIPLPLVILTGTGSEHLAVEALKVGVDDYLIKDPDGGYLDLLPLVLPDVVRQYGDRLARQRAEQALHRRNRELALLNRLSRELTGTLDLQRVIRRLLQEITEIIGTEGASVWLRAEGQEEELVCEALFHEGELWPLSELRLLLDQGIAGWVVRNDESAIVPCAPDDPRFFPDIDELTGFRTVSVLAVPLRVRGRVVGALEAVNKQGGELNADDLSLVQTLGASAAIAIENARLFQEAKREIAERKQAEEEREVLIAELEAKNAELERFTYTVSHDLKSPLITIQGFLSFLERDAMAGDIERLKTDVARISDTTDKMDRLLSELLELSRIGRVMNLPEEIAWSELAHEVADLLAGRLKERGVEIEIAPNMPTVYADRLRLRQVLQNLVDNAVKFMGDQPHPRIEIGMRRDGEESVFYVRDNGVGIEPQYQKKVFDLFEKLDSKSEGTGLGLAIVKRIVEVHGGRIWVESEGAGLGSMFCFTLAGKRGLELEKEV